jgi:hypothetical protein
MGDGSDVSSLVVESYTPRRLATLASIPRTFAVLSVDAEGVDVAVLHGFISAGYRPLFAIVELRGAERVARHDVPFMKAAGYEEIAHVGSNFIWERTAELVQ